MGGDGFFISVQSCARVRVGRPGSGEWFNGRPKLIVTTLAPLRAVLVPTEPTRLARMGVYKGRPGIQILRGPGLWMGVRIDRTTRDRSSSRYGLADRTRRQLRWASTSQPVAGGGRRGTVMVVLPVCGPSVGQLGGGWWVVTGLPVHLHQWSSPTADRRNHRIGRRSVPKKDRSRPIRADKWLLVSCHWATGHASRSAQPVRTGDRRDVGRPPVSPSLTPQVLCPPAVRSQCWPIRCQR